MQRILVLLLRLYVCFIFNCREFNSFRTSVVWNTWFEENSRRQNHENLLLVQNVKSILQFINSLYCDFLLMSLEYMKRNINVGYCIVTLGHYVDEQRHKNPCTTTYASLCELRIK